MSAGGNEITAVGGRHASLVKVAQALVRVRHEVVHRPTHESSHAARVGAHDVHFAARSGRRRCVRHAVACLMPYALVAFDWRREHTASADRQVISTRETVNSALALIAHALVHMR